MDSWTELTQATIRARIREREVEAAGERLAATARSAAVRIIAAMQRAVAAPRPIVGAAETAPVGEPIAVREVPCADCPPIRNAA
jgi:hypothetical protein